MFYELEGTIKNVKYINKETFFEIESNSTKKIYHVLNKFFCPAHIDDKITCKCTEDKDFLNLISHPIVFISSAEKKVISIFNKFLKSNYKSKILYEFFKQSLNFNHDKYMYVGYLKFKSPIFRNLTQEELITEIISDYSWKYKYNKYIIKPILLCNFEETCIDKIMKYWYKNFVLRRLYLYGLTNKEIDEAIDHFWNPNLIYYQVLENPYIVDNLPLNKIESIINRYNISIDEKVIYCGKVVNFLSEQSKNNGHMCYPIKDVKNKFPYLDEFILVKKYGCFINEYIYLNHQKYVQDILSKNLVNEINNINIFDDQEKTNDEQKQAIEMVFKNKISVITGCAGTGKSTVISKIISICDKLNKTYLISSFTGKAISRLRKIIKSNYILTLHMILYSDINFDVDYLIIDECSMVGSNLLAQVILKLNIKNFVFVGDYRQLQPIDAGNLLERLLKNIPNIELKEDHRIIHKGTLWNNTKKFITNENLYFDWKDDCNFVSGDIDEVIDIVKKLHNNDVKSDQITIISPFNKNLKELNEKCINIFLKDSKYVTDIWGNMWKIGTRVMMTENRYDIKVMNGEEGIIVNITNSDLLVKFNDSIVNIPYNKNNQDEERPLTSKLLVASWAISVHKSQGSEWDYIIFYIPYYSLFLNKKLIYTAISRAKNALYVVAPDLKTFESALINEPQPRYDFLFD